MRTPRQISRHVLQMAAARYLQNWLFVDRRYLPFEATIADEARLAQFLRTYGVSRNFGKNDNQTPRLEALQRALRTIDTSRPDDEIIDNLLEATARSYQKRPLSAVSKLLWLRRVQPDSDKATLPLFDKWAVAGLKQLGITAKHNRGGSSYGARTREYQRFAGEWWMAYDEAQARVRDACEVVANSHYATRAALYWRDDLQALKACMARTWFHQRAFDQALHLEAERWSMFALQFTKQELDY